MAHFWYSEKQAKYFTSYNKTPWRDYDVKKNTAVINGESVVYTCMNKENDHETNWDDIRYLGQGDYEKCIGEW